ncbi:hypothetical protein ABW19_dt0209827 [Dactylella cylindrospora]|nr:hypothetical protein ABW19_dt0209827 [Dactylella cylindrospora]
MAGYESFLQFEDSDRQETFYKMLTATGASIPANTTTAPFDTSIYQKPELDFFTTSETSTIPASFFSLEEAQYAGYSLYPFTEVPRTAFPYFNEEPTVFVQPPTLPSNYISTDVYRGPTSPSVASSIAEGFDFTSGQSSTASGASTSSSDHGSPYMAAQEWSMNPEDMNTWTGVTWEQPELKDACVNPSLINNSSRQSSVEAVPITPSSPKHVRRQSNTFRVSPYPTPSAAPKGHRRSPSQFSSEEYFPRTPDMSREPSNKSAPSPERSASSSGTNNDNYCSACGKVFRDLKAHQITHMDERPEKCPIPTCEYAKKGFARKYDCQRHTLTHYKGTMVCGFCPGSGLPSEKTFNRADVFKRHLMSVHNVEQTAPNGRPKKVNGRGASVSSSGSPRAPSFQTSYKDVTGKCSTCNATFANAQQFYEHLDDCVLSKVVKPEPEGAINSANLDSVKDLEEVQESLAAHGLFNTEAVEGEDVDMSEDEEEESEDEDDKSDPSFGTKKSKKARKSITGTGVAGR